MQGNYQILIQSENVWKIASSSGERNDSVITQRARGGLPGPLFPRAHWWNTLSVNGQCASYDSGVSNLEDHEYSFEAKKGDGLR